MIDQWIFFGICSVLCTCTHIIAAWKIGPTSYIYSTDTIHYAVCGFVVFIFIFIVLYIWYCTITNVFFLCNNRSRFIFIIYTKYFVYTQISSTKWIIYMQLVIVRQASQPSQTSAYFIFFVFFLFECKRTGFWWQCVVNCWWFFSFLVVSVWLRAATASPGQMIIFIRI